MIDTYKFEPGDIINKANAGFTNIYTEQFTYNKEYLVLSGKECNRNMREIYVINDKGDYVMLHQRHFKLSIRTQRNETIGDILS